jgi:hypothetical protein
MALFSWSAAASHSRTVRRSYWSDNGAFPSVSSNRAAFRRVGENMLRLLLLLFFIPSQLWANQPDTGYNIPAGAQRGTTVNFHVGGCFLHGETRFEMIGEGITASPIVREVPTIRLERLPVLEPTLNKLTDYYLDHLGEVTIAGDAALGSRIWRVWTSQGASRNLKFEVGDLPEIVEAEIDGEPLPVDVQAPLTINGRIYPRKDVDIWSFHAKAKQEYTLFVSAQQLGSPLDSRIEIRSPDGKIVAEATGDNNRDPKLYLQAQEDGEYKVHIHDVRFEGDQSFVYRLTITDGPHVDSAYPLGGQRGTEVALQLTGHRLPETTATLTLPADPNTQSCGQSFQIAGCWTNPCRLEIGDLPELLETADNDAPAKASIFAVPATLNGRIERAGDVDYWAFEASADQKIDFDLRASRLGSPLDSVLVIEDTEGKELATNDDFDSSNSDSKLTFSVSQDGQYRVGVRERFASRGGAEFAYRLHVRPSTPGFRLFINDNPGKQQFGSYVNVVRTPAINPDNDVKPPQATMKVQAERLGGFTGEIKLAIAGVPAGVSIEGDTIAEKKNDTTLKFSAAIDTKIDVTKISIRGTATIADKDVTQPVQIDGVNHVLLAIAMPTPFAIRQHYVQSLAPRGSTYHRQFDIDRSGYDGPIQVRLSDRQQRHMQGVAGPTIEVPAGKNEFEYPLQLHPTMWIGKTSRTIVMLSAEVKDHDGSVHRVSYSDHQPQGNQMIVVAEGELLTVSPDSPSLIIQPDKTVKLPISILRESTLGRLPVEIKLLVPAHTADITCETVVAGENENMIELQLQVGSNPGPFPKPFTIQATAVTQQGRYVAVSSVELIR